jgi:hypothetical protein
MSDETEETTGRPRGRGSLAAARVDIANALAAWRCHAREHRARAAAAGDLDRVTQCEAHQADIDAAEDRVASFFARVVRERHHALLLQLACESLLDAGDDPALLESARIMAAAALRAAGAPAGPDSPG